MAAILVPGNAIFWHGFPRQRFGRQDFQSRRIARTNAAAIPSIGNSKNNDRIEGDRGRIERNSESEASGDCSRCGSSGSIQCLTCAGTGLYVESILESQGIITKVRCLGCGGAGKIMCPKCGGRCHS